MSFAPIVFRAVEEWQKMLPPRAQSRPKLSQPPSYDYWALFRRGGVRLSLAFFRECHAFDLARGTDTHAELKGTSYTYAPENFDRGSWYLSSWTSELLNAFAVVKTYLKDDFRDFAFVDAGCGKGKALLVWQEQLVKWRIRSMVAGVEYYEPLAAIAQRNYRKLFAKPGNIFVGDVTRFDYRGLGDKLILYMFHPFDGVVLRELLNNLTELKTVIIYNNPVHEDVITDFGYRTIYQKTGWNLCMWTSIFVSENMANGQ